MPFTIEMEINVFKNLEPDPGQHYAWVAHIMQTEVSYVLQPAYQEGIEQ